MCSIIALVSKSCWSSLSLSISHWFSFVFSSLDIWLLFTIDPIVECTTLELVRLFGWVRPPGCLFVYLFICLFGFRHRWGFRIQTQKSAHTLINWLLILAFLLLLFVFVYCVFVCTVVLSGAQRCSVLAISTSASASTSTSTSLGLSFSFSFSFWVSVRSWPSTLAVLNILLGSKKFK